MVGNGKTQGGNEHGRGRVGFEKEDLMDEVTRCTKCGKQKVPVFTLSGGTELQCICCDDPAVKLTQSPATAPDETVAVERVRTARLKP